MQISSKKQNINDSLSVISSLSNGSNLNNLLNNLNRDNDIFNNNSKDSIIFIITLLIKIIGIEIMKDVLRDILNKNIKDIDNQIKLVLKQELLSDDNERNVGYDMVNDGVVLPVKSIDYSGKLSQSNTVDDNTIDKSIKESIDSNGQTKNFETLDITYNNNNDSVTYKAKNNEKYNVFMGNLIEKTTFINEKRIINDVINLLFGTLTFSLLKTRKELELDENFNKIINKVIENDNVNDEIFNLSIDEINAIDKKIEDNLNGVYNLDFDCSFIGTQIDIETLNEILNSDDIYNALDNTFNNLLPSNNPDLSLYGGGTNQNDNNKLNINTINNNKFNNNRSTKENIYKNFMNGVTTIIIKNSILSPQNIVLFNIYKKVIENNNEIYSGVDILKSQKNILNCLNKNVKDKIANALYKKLKKEVLKIVKPLGIAILNEKLDNYSKTITNLNIF